MIGLIFKVLIGLAAAFGIYHFTRIKDVRSKIYTIGLSISIILTLIPLINLWNAGFTMFGLFTLFIVINSFTNSQLSNQKKRTLWVIVIPVLLVVFFKLNHWPGTAELGWFMIVPLYFYFKNVLSNREEFKNEFGYLTILATHALIVLSINIGWLIT